jgi:glycosyltransferase involved in cell wall biosynthesis
MKLSILIPTTPDRNHFIAALGKQFESQLGACTLYEVIEYPVNMGMICRELYPNDVEVLYYEDDKQTSIGFKRNKLKDLARGKYIAYVDSDDRIGPNYFKHAFTGIEQDVDACGLTGIITEDGQNPKKFVHSFMYDSWYEKDNIYYRNTNHLNVIKRNIAQQIQFPDINSGEDHNYSKELYKRDLVTSEYWDENEILYYYDFRSKK